MLVHKLKVITIMLRESACLERAIGTTDFFFTKNTNNATKMLSEENRRFCRVFNHILA
jgi:hypothetical protein